MSATPEMVRTKIELRLVMSDGPDRAVNADVNYSATDPYAVRVDFHTGSAEVVEWTFARSLLSDGVTHAVGEGDVHVWPALKTDRQRVCLSLSSPSGRALFEAPLPRVVEFLSRTYELVPTGCESDFVDIDAGLAELLGDEV
jgi:Streptomyces sporulation and cell division protein, SsgA